MRFTRGIGWGGAVLALAVAVALFTRFSFDDTMRRDEAIYAYGGQQLAAGVPLYRGIFDPKTPLAQALAGAAAALAPGRGFADVHAIRVAFFVAACLSVVAVYWLGLVLWGSPLAALLGATVFASFRSFALDAVGGPDAKTPGILFAVLALALLVRRRWFWGALAGSLAALVWQPFAVYVLVAVGAAFIGGRWRGVRDAVAGAAMPVAVAVAWLWAAGSLPAAVEATVRYPLTRRRAGAGDAGGADRAHRRRRSRPGYRVSGWLLVAGLVAVVAAMALRGRRAWLLAASLIADGRVLAPRLPGHCGRVPAAAIRGGGDRGSMRAADRPPASRSIGGIAVVGDRFAMSFAIYSGAPRARHRAAARARAGAVGRAPAQPRRALRGVRRPALARADGHARPDALRLPLGGRRRLGGAARVRRLRGLRGRHPRRGGPRSSWSTRGPGRSPRAPSAG